MNQVQENNSSVTTKVIDLLNKNPNELLSKVETAVRAGKEYLFSIQREDSRWCGELESNPTITAEYVYLNQILGRDHSVHGAEIIRYLRGLQNADGSFGVARRWDGDVSSTAEVYLALRILGLEIEDELMLRAQRYILRHGGLEKLRIFTRINFALFGLIPWSAVPALPPELILLPNQSTINVYSLSSWARGTMVPLFVIVHHQPIFALPNGKTSDNNWLDHLWIDAKDKSIPYTAPWTQLVTKLGLSSRTALKSLFNFSDVFLKGYEKVKIKKIREIAVKRCVKWILDRQEETGDWAGIFPPMFNGIIALTLEGYGVDSDPIQKGIKAMDHFSWQDNHGFRVQACVSPVWDTALAAISLLDANVDANSARLKGPIQWLLDRQLLVEHGDWKVYRPNLISGGWSFEYSNSWYPDVDDTAAVMLAILKQNPKAASSEAICRAAEWTVGMQNKDGGWAAFDVDNDKLFLNEIPFADIDALCDPSSPDIAGRVVEAFGLMLEHLPLTEDFLDLRARMIRANEKAIAYLRKSQETQGSWFGRWGVNYIYGTSNVLCGLASLAIPASDPMIVAALPWLLHCQNRDGGWGENIASYADKRWMGKGESTASQTAWALMGLLAYLPANHPSIERGVRWLIHHQAPTDASIGEAFEGGARVPTPEGLTWVDEHFTGTGFPNHFYLRYHLYAHYFPMMALGRFLQAQQK
jgi:squalene-hopene/tetraprenyl-beta-curcumene cyclase